MKTCLITGASGFLGANASVNFGQKYETIGMVRNGISLQCAKSIALDLTDSEDLRNLIAEVRPDVIFHGAALSSHEACQSDPELAYRVNVEATKTIALSAEASGTKLVYISTDAVFNGSRGNYSENDEPEPFSVYGETKLLGENAVLEVNPNALVLRTNFFGWSPTGNRSIMEFFLNNLMSRVSTLGYEDFLVTSIYVQHLLQVARKLLDGDHRGVFHVGSSDVLSKYEFGRRVCEVFDLDASNLHPGLAREQAHVTSRSRNLSLNTEYAASILGRRMPTQTQGLLEASLGKPFR